ncbi:H-NS family nucleoid-associated regulatory protein [Parahaliea mediterranea]|uniref:H-NS histone family protein n=1 Tax=Parahaliea mediterranea TaxID=651086 RepID=UPI000E2ED160|nr:H-NS family nucleoid-associated regulatory protein [Parahaliea mediterranea]
MKEFLSVLTHNRRLKAAVKNASVSDLEKAFDQLGLLIEEKKVEEEAAIAEEQEKLAMKASILAQMQEAGLDISDLAQEGAKKPRKRKAGKRAIKYRFTDKSGEEHTWAGVGRAPKVFAELKAQGKLEKHRV